MTSSTIDIVQSRSRSRSLQDIELSSFTGLQTVILEHARKN